MPCSILLKSYGATVQNKWGKKKRLVEQISKTQTSVGDERKQRTEDDGQLWEMREEEWGSEKEKSQIQQEWKREQTEDWEEREREKEGSERRTSMHMKERFFCRLAVAATQYFNMLLDPDRPGLEVCVYLCVCVWGSTVCSSLSYYDKLISSYLGLPFFTVWLSILQSWWRKRYKIEKKLQ